jgi:D-glycero-alpha-D-manno-heptose 1-phosphate guanylyltransferase
MKIFVLAGGFGSRLQSTVADVPKALAPVFGKPFLQLQLAHWVDQGLRNFTFLLHYKANTIIDFLKEQQLGILKDCQIDWIIESQPMDTGGAISNAVKKLDLNGDFLITNADTWLGCGVNELMHSPAPAIAVVNLGDVSRYGQVLFDHRSIVTGFDEKKSLPTRGWINAGLYRLNTALFKNWEDQPFSLERDLFKILARNLCMTAVPLQTDFIDIGIPDDYHRFCRWVEAGRKIPLCI